MLGSALAISSSTCDVSQRVQLGAAQRARQQHPEKAALDQRLDHPLGQLTPFLDFVGGIFEQRPERPRTFDIIDAARFRGCQIELQRRHSFSPFPAASSRCLSRDRQGYIAARFCGEDFDGRRRLAMPGRDAKLGDHAAYSGEAMRYPGIKQGRNGIREETRFPVSRVRGRKSHSAFLSRTIRWAAYILDYKLLRNTIACPVRSTIGNSGLSAKNSSTARRAPGQDGSP